MLKESNTRKGFFEHGEFMALRDLLPSYLKPVVTFAYHTGWRESEILGIKWNRVDLNERVVKLDPGKPKNEDARNLFLNDELFQEIKILQAKRAPDCPFVFLREGQKIKRFTKAWETACRKAGLWKLDEKKGRMAPTRIFHAFRRTAVRNMVRSGIRERVAMAISGHRTRSVFERYNIVSLKDLKEAARKQESYILTKNGYHLVTIDPEEALSGDADL
jgi:integrase